MQSSRNYNYRKHSKKKLWKNYDEWTHIWKADQLRGMDINATRKEIKEQLDIYEDDLTDFNS